jgi:hypothetical protein
LRSPFAPSKAVAIRLLATKARQPGIVMFAVATLATMSAAPADVNASAAPIKTDFVMSNPPGAAGPFYIAPSGATLAVANISNI